MALCMLIKHFTINKLCRQGKFERVSFIGTQALGVNLWLSSKQPRFKYEVRIKSPP